MAVRAANLPLTEAITVETYKQGSVRNISYQAFERTVRAGVAILTFAYWVYLVPWWVRKRTKRPGSG